MRLTKLFTALFALMAVVSCVTDDDFETPDFEITDPNPSGDVISINALANIYTQAVLAEAEDLGINPGNAEAIAQLRGSFRLDLTESGNFIQGFVISSDESGNWFEELIIQDAPSEPNAGVRILIDESPLFTFYEFGRRIFVKLDGLQVGDSNGVLTLGVGNNLDKIPAPVQFDFISRSPDVATIVPTETTIMDFSESMENTYVQLTDVQFVREEVVDATFTFAGEPFDEFDGERTIMSCENDGTVILSTSTFAAFRSVALPAGRGSISGTLSRNFFGDTFNLVINDTDDVDFNNEDRCDPVEGDCGLADSVGDNVLYQDDFENQTPNQPILGNGWTNFQQAGTQPWEAFVETGENASIGISARVGSFNSGDASTISWLVTPEIDLIQNEGETLQFLTSTSFVDGSNLEVLFSTDWDGVPENIPNATWKVIPSATIAQNEDPFSSYISSGIVDLSCIEDNWHIGFRYTGSGDENFDGTYELEGVLINAN